MDRPRAESPTPASEGTSEVEARAASGPADTRTRLLDAAERLFAEHTYAETSLRQITAQAEANLAAVHYHFGSKEALFLAVFQRRIEPINAERLDRLRILQERFAPEDPPLDELLTALFEPAVRLRECADGRHFAQIVSRSLWADGEHWRSVASEFDTVRDAFIPILRRACPQLDLSALMWRMHFALSGMCMVLSRAERIGELTAGVCDPNDVGQMVRQLVRFTAAGLQAPDGDPQPNRTDLDR